MKTNQIALALLASAALTLSACVNEKELNVGSIGDDEIAFRMGAVQTRSAVEAEGLGTFNAGTVQTESGDVFVLEETVESMDNAPVTRGTPAFTENVEKLYGTFIGYCADLGGDASYAFDGSTYWTHHYAGKGELWPEGASYQFFLRMPGDVPGVNGEASGLTYNSDGSIEFNYTSPASAADQKDILFTSKTLTKNGDNIYFYHVLTGIKFQNYYSNKEDEGRTVAKTKIKQVTLSGLKNTGHCKVSPDGTTPGSSATVSVWSGQDGNATFSTTALSDTAKYSNGSYGLDTLLNKTASARNVNDDNGTQTFWVVPQDFEDSTVTITVKFDVELVNGETTTVSCKDTTLTVYLGKRSWKAGEIHTFTLKPTVPGVEIDDTLEEYVKSDVVVKNTGNVYEYVRVNLIGNWVGQLWESEDESGNVTYSSDKTIMNGYTDDEWEDEPNKIYKNNTMVEAWNDKDGKTSYGTFKDLTPKSTVIPATEENTVNNWVRYDKYYYYINPIGPDDSVTDDLFKSYTVGKSPDFYIPDMWGIRRKAGNVHLEMDIIVQAIPAPVNTNGEVIDNEDGKGYIRAWVQALGKTDPEDLLDL